MADMGSLISTDVALQGARLEVPILTRGKEQLSAKEVEDARNISREGVNPCRASHWLQ